MSSNRLKINTDKTQFIWPGTHQQLVKINCPTITLAGNVINRSADVTVLGVVLDPEMTFATHIRRLARCFYQLRQLRSVHSALTLDASKTVVHAFVSSRVDYCNSVFSLACAKHLRPLQFVLNAAARVFSRRQKYDHITDVVCDQLHWLPVTERIEYKLCSLVYKCLHQSGPLYLSEMCNFVSDLPGHRHLCSAAHSDLVELRTLTSTYGPRSFAACGPKNRLPLTVRDHSLSVGQFSRYLKTELFKRAY